MIDEGQWWFGPSGGSDHSEEWLDSGRILRVESAGFPMD